MSAAGTQPTQPTTKQQQIQVQKAGNAIDVSRHERVVMQAQLAAEAADQPPAVCRGDCLILSRRGHGGCPPYALVPVATADTCQITVDCARRPHLLPLLHEHALVAHTSPRSSTHMPQSEGPLGFFRDPFFDALGFGIPSYTFQDPQQLQLAERSVTAMSLDVKENDSAFEIQADVPGISKDDVKVRRIVGGLSGRCVPRVQVRDIAVRRCIAPPSVCRMPFVTPLRVV